MMINYQLKIPLDKLGVEVNKKKKYSGSPFNTNVNNNNINTITIIHIFLHSLQYNLINFLPILDEEKY